MSRFFSRNFLTPAWFILIGVVALSTPPPTIGMAAFLLVGGVVVVPAVVFALGLRLRPGRRLTTSCATDRDRQHTLGMTDADMIDAVSQICGAPASSKVPPATIAPHDDVTASRTVAYWTDGAYSATLFR